MVKRIAIMAALVWVLAACGQVQQSQSESAELNKIAELVSEPLGFDGKQVSFEGIITHICRGSGDKMRVNQIDDPDFSIMVMLEQYQTQFNPDFEGMQVKLTGLLKTQVLNLDHAGERHDHDHAHEDGHECSSTEEAIKRLEERGITPDVRAFVELKSFEIVDPIIGEEETKEEIEVAEVAHSGGGC